MEQSKLVFFLNKELNVRQLNRVDDSKNGLQVKGRKDVKKIGLCVDACLDSFSKAKAAGCDMIICHHGLLWKEKRKMLDSLLAKRVSYLKKNKISLYAAHLPIDCHPAYGNNSVICSKLGIKNIKKFGSYKHAVWGYIGTLNTTFSKLSRDAKRLFGNKAIVLSFGKNKIRTVAVVSGGASFAVGEAGKRRADCLIIGESSHSAYCKAKDMQLNIIFGGHYATEVFGVKAVGNLLEKKFGVKCVFIDSPTGL
jgi:dinuclear metal center YbgI/SA1388 family protein